MTGLLERPRHAFRRRWLTGAHRGRAVECPLCGKRFDRFRDDWNRPKAICWWCGSHERHRALWLYLNERPELLAGIGSLLHWAPEFCLRERLAADGRFDYVTADLDPQVGDLALDITDIALADHSYDATLCSHVLEHVVDDRAAMRELGRILRPGGWAIFMVPIDDTRATTLEDDTIATAEQRELAYWQHDHVRLYGNDFADRLRETGFEVTRERPAERLGQAAAERYGLLATDDVYLCPKPAP